MIFVDCLWSCRVSTLSLSLYPNHFNSPSHFNWFFSFFFHGERLLFSSERIVPGRSPRSRCWWWSNMAQNSWKDAQEVCLWWYCLPLLLFFFLSCLEKIFYAFEFAFVVLLIFMVSFANSCCLRGGFLKLCVSSSIMASGYVLFYVFFMGLILSNRIACKVHHFMFYM